MPRTKEENDRIKTERREDILRASLSVLAERGLFATRISDIAKAAGVSYGLVYSYFPSKERIFIELINRYLSSGEEIVRTIEQESQSPVDKIVKLFTLLHKSKDADFQSEHFFRLILQLNFYPHLWKDLIIDNFQEDPIYSFLTEKIKEGKAEGTISDVNSKTLSLFLGYIAMGMNMSGNEMRDSDIQAEDIDQLIRKILQ